MMTPFKWITMGVFLIVVSMFFVFYNFNQDITIKTTAEIDTVADAIASGIVRTEIDDDGVYTEKYFNAEELVSNITSQLVKVQKNNTYDIKLDYVFFDKNGQITEQEDSIASIQFRVQYYDQGGGLKGTAERHIALNQKDS